MFQPLIAAFSGTSIEFFETTVIAYAFVRAGYLRESMLAVIIGHIFVFLIALLFYPAHVLISGILLRLIATILLISMGLFWVLKSIKRLYTHKRPSWAEKPLETLGVTQVYTSIASFSPFIFILIMKTSVIEAIEILMVIIPVGAASGDWGQSICGALSAIAFISVLAFILHEHLKDIPEVKLKLIIGMILLTIGISWLFEIYYSD